MALEKVEGQIRNLDYTARTFIIHEKDGKETRIKYNQGKDKEIQQLKNWYFKGIVGERDTEGIIVVDSLTRFDKPADWPEQKSNGGNKGGNYPPRDPKVQTYIIRQSCQDRATQIVLHGASKEAELPALVKDICEIAEVLEGWVLR